MKGANRDVPAMLRDTSEDHLAVHSPVSMAVEGRIHPL